MAEAWQEQGRVNQKRRTRAAILVAAQDLLKQGKQPSVAEVADAALVSRTTAYRYFPTQEALLFEAALESTATDVDRLFEETAATSEDPAFRLDALLKALQGRAVANEAAFRTLLRLSLERSPEGEKHHDGTSAPSRLRGGRRIHWIGEALAPIRDRFDRPSYERLMAALSLCMGIESLVVLRDVCALEPEEAEEVSRWAAQALLQAALSGAGQGPHSLSPGAFLP